jgi:Mg2+/citrate symporter
MRSVRTASILAAGLWLCVGLSGCLVAGYTSSQGWWVWPGSIIATLLVLLLTLLFNRR